MGFVSLLLVSFFVAVPAFAGAFLDFTQDRQENFKNTLFGPQLKNIVSQIYSKHTKDAEKCEEGVELIEGDIQAIRGSFSSRNADEVLVVFESKACLGGVTDLHGNIALVQNGRVVDHRTDVNAAEFELVFDLDEDGASEVVTSLSSFALGYKTTSADTLTFKNGSISKVTLVNGIVREDSCEAEKDGQIFASIFEVSMDSPTGLKQKVYVKSCEGGEFTHHFDGAMDESD